MTRTITATNEAVLDDDVVRPAVFAKLEFGAGTQYVNNSPMTLTFGGNDYIGVGNFAGISKVSETGDIQSTSLELTLSGVDPAMVSIALNENYQGKKGTIYLGFMDANFALVDDPVLVFKGRMDTMPIKLDTESVIGLTIESRLADLFRSRVIRFNNADQQQRFPGDKGLEFVEEMVAKEIVWKNN